MNIQENQLFWLRLAPVGVTVLLLAWTAAVSPFTEYGDGWAVGPAVLAAPIVILLHIGLIVLGPERLNQAFYAAIHLVIFFQIWFFALVLISKSGF